MALPPRLAETLSDLALLTDRQDRIEALVSLSRAFVPVPAELAAPPYPEANRVPGCESEAFTFVGLQEGGLHLEFAILNPQGVSAMALAAILKQGLDGEPPAAAAEVPEEIVFDLFGRELSMGKSLGLTNMVRMVKAQAARL
ncbi:MAG: SufE family protein [Fimbriimonadaceae bacterium]|nr:SufE family protein [Fimbriimonadaceae bacterium]QYK55712.1 MAG: SufE family protein [Fimbriimonadaceae bacterium]